MGGFLAGVAKFIGAIFVGAGAGASAGYILAVNLARIGALALIAKLTAPKLDFSDIATAKTITVRDPIAPQKFTYGRDMVSGPLIFANTAGTDNRDIYLLVALTGHEIDSVVKYRIDDVDIPLTDLSGAEDGNVTGGKFDGVARVDLRKGTLSQTAISTLTSTFPTLFNSAHTGQGWSIMLWKFSLVEGNEDVFKTQPQNLKAEINAYKVYDPRRYALNDDPDFDTAELGIESGHLRWWRSSGQNLPLLSSFTSGSDIVVHTSDVRGDIFSQRIPVDTTKRYRVRVTATELGSDSNHYLFVTFYDSDGDLINNSSSPVSDATGWGGIGTHHYYLVNGEFGDTATVYQTTFGPGGTASIPTGAVEMAIGGLLNFGNEAGSVSQLADLAVYEEPTGGARHDVTDSTTWEWSDNPALCLAHFRMDQKFGGRESADRIYWPRVINAAQICDELVAIPTSATQKRYTCNVTFESTTQRGEVRSELLSAMMGREVFSQGQWHMWAGAPIEADVTLTEANLRAGGSITLQTGSPTTERYNRVRGKYIDKDKDYVPTTYPEARSSTYVTQDGGEVLPDVADFMSTTNFYEAQRKSVFTLRMSRNQRIVVFEGNFSCFRVQPGTTVELDCAEFGFSGEKFFVTQWDFTMEGVTLTMVQEVDSVWDDIAEGAYATRSPTGVLTFVNTGVPAPDNLTAERTLLGVRLNWTNPVVGPWDHIEIWGSNTNVRGDAVRIATTQDTTYEEIISPRAMNTRYYWIRAVNSFGEVSAWEPNLTTTTATSDPSRERPNWIADPEFDESNDEFDGTNEWWEAFLGGGGDSITLAVGGGQGGSNAADIVQGGGSTAPALRNMKNIRYNGNTGTFVFLIKYKTVGSTDALDHDNFVTLIRFHSSEFDEAGLVVSLGPVVTLPRASDWVSVQIVHSFKVAEDLSNWISFGIGFEGNQGTADTLRVDSVQILPIGPTFGDVVDAAGEVHSGVVPQAASADSTKFLRGDGTWQTPAGGGGAAQLNELSDVNTSTPTNRNVLVADGVDFESRALEAADTQSGTFANARISASSVTQHQASINHDALSGFVANEHLDWTADLGATNIHAGNITAAAVTQHQASINHDALSGFVVNEHLDWTADLGATNIHINNLPSGLNADTLDTLDSSAFLRSNAADDFTGASLAFADGSELRLGASGDMCWEFDGVDIEVFNLVGANLVVNWRDGYVHRFYDSGDVNYTQISTTGGESNINSSAGDVHLQRAAVTMVETQQYNTTGNSSGGRVRSHNNALQDLGYNVLPSFNFNASDTLEAGHCGHMTGKTNTTAYTLTGPTDSDVDFPVGGVCQVANLGASVNYTIADTATCTMFYCNGAAAPQDIAGSGVLAPGGLVTLWRRTTSEIYIFGFGFTP